MGRGEAMARRRGEVAGMGGHHQRLRRLEPEGSDRIAVERRLRLVIPRKLAPEDRVEAPAVMTGQRDGEADGGVRERGQPISPAQAGEGVRDFGPGVEAVPSQDEVALRRRVEPGDPKLYQDLLQALGMQGVEVGPGPPPRSDRFQ